MWQKECVPRLTLKNFYLCKGGGWENPVQGQQWDNI